MSKIKKWHIILGVAVLIIGIPTVWFLNTFVLDKRVNEPFSDIIEAYKNDPRASFPETVASGGFYGTPDYFAGGGTRLIKIGGDYYLRFEDDFKVARLPGTFIYLGSDTYYSEDALVGELKGNAGSQNYKIPSNLSPLEFNRVWIWSKDLQTVLGSAELKSAAAPAAHDVKQSKLEENAG